MAVTETRFTVSTYKSDAYVVCSHLPHVIAQTRRALRSSIELLRKYRVRRISEVALHAENPSVWVDDSQRQSRRVSLSKESRGKAVRRMRLALLYGDDDGVT
jgi:hypothetical protein